MAVVAAAAVGKPLRSPKERQNKDFRSCDPGHSRKTILRGYLCFVEVAMKFTRVLLGVFALLLSGAAITLVSQEKSSPTRASYNYAPTSEQTMRGWGG